MLLLAFDTATPAVTVALHDGSRVLGERTAEDARRHGELLAPGIAAVLADAGVEPGDLTDVAVGVGPGPYTGLRVGLVTARMLALALPVRVHGVCTLDAVAFAAARTDPFIVATDARRKEVYWALYRDALTRAGGPAVDRPADVAARHPGLPAAGPGARLYSAEFGTVFGPAAPSAAALAGLAARRLADGGSGLLPPEPLYLRRPDARVPGPSKPVLAR